MGMGYKIALDDEFINLGFKAAGDPITSTSFGTRYTDLNVLPHAFPPANIIPLIPVVTVTAGNVRYYQATQPMGGTPAFIAEAAAKPEVQPRWAAVDAPMETIADWTAVTLQALDDLPQLRGVVDSDLRMGLISALDNMLINGTGTTPQIRGILNFTGVQSVAFVAATSIPGLDRQGHSRDCQRWLRDTQCDRPESCRLVDDTNIEGFDNRRLLLGSANRSGHTEHLGHPRCDGCEPCSRHRHRW